MSSAASVTVEFFEKPGCINNTKQKKELLTRGYRVVAFDLLAHPWTPETLRPFFGDHPVADWFNRTSPRVKSGAVDPNGLGEQSALALMVEDPLLIRRPLLHTDKGHAVGWEPGSEHLDSIGIVLPPPAVDIVTCPRSHEDKGCGPGGAEK